MLAVFAGGMIVAFGKLRPLFRDRGKITAEISGRLAESFGGIRIVKAYVAEDREDRVFANGIHELFENVRKTLTGMSRRSRRSAASIIGVIGVVIMVVGGRSILAGTMTLGDFVMYIFFVGLLAVPLIQMSSIGTQLSEALAGLDRIREIKQMATEDDEDATREPLGARARRGCVRRCVVRVRRPASPSCSTCRLRARPARRPRWSGSSGSGKSTLIGLVMAFNRPDRGRVLVDGRDLAGVRLRDYRAQLGVVLQDNFMFDGTVAENIRFSRAAGDDGEVKAVSRHRALRRVRRAGFPRSTTRWWGSAASGCRAASGSGWRSRARFSPIRES